MRSARDKKLEPRVSVKPHPLVEAVGNQVAPAGVKPPPVRVVGGPVAPAGVDACSTEAGVLASL